MTRAQRAAVWLFAMGMMGLGILALIYGDFAMGWQPVAAWMPGRTALAYGSGVLMLLSGAGLLFRASVAWSVRVLFLYLIVWALLKVPALVVAPQIEGVWLGIGELTVLLAGGWTLFATLGDIAPASKLARLAGERGVWIARVLFAVSLLPIGLSHLIYTKETVALVPAWLPDRTFWAYLTGVGQMACGVGVLIRLWPRVAAYGEAAMVSLFALLVWAPAIVAGPRTRLPWTAFWISWAIAAAAWVVAVNAGSKRPATEGN
ncbi:MAG TPA: DoxX family membrane protein [Terracidiphilus sp.]|nr:DoxX family membrane protein [Terracidiphilus sp.]